MKITLESESLMTLKDHNITHFIGGLAFFVLGAGFAYVSRAEIIGLGFGLLFAVIGLWILATTKLVNLSLDKGMGRAKFSLRSLLKNESRDVSIGEITSLVLEKQILRSRKGNPKRQFTLAFLLESGDRLEFELGTMSGGIDVLVSPDDKMRAEAQKVSDFIGVPLSLEGPPSLHETLSTLKEGIVEGMDTARNEKS